MSLPREASTLALAAAKMVERPCVPVAVGRVVMGLCSDLVFVESVGGDDAESAVGVFDDGDAIPGVGEAGDGVGEGEVGAFAGEDEDFGDALNVDVVVVIEEVGDVEVELVRGGGGHGCGSYLVPVALGEAKPSPAAARMSAMD